MVCQRMIRRGLGRWFATVHRWYGDCVCGRCVCVVPVVVNGLAMCTVVTVWLVRVVIVMLGVVRRRMPF